MGFQGPRQKRTDYDVGEISRGIVFGLVVRVPASGLTATYEGGIVRVGNPSYPLIQDSSFDPQKSTFPPIEKIVAAGTQLFTASKDTYVYIDSTGAFKITAVANAAAKPVIPDGRGEWLAKVVTSGTDITGITDLRRLASRGEIVAISRVASFETGEVGADYLRVPFAGRLIAITGNVIKTIAATDQGTITAAIGLNDVYTNVTTGVLTAAISDAVAVRYEAFPTAANVVQAGQTLRLTAAKSTAGGRVQVTCYFLADN